MMGICTDYRWECVMSDFDRKAAVVATTWGALDNNPDWADIIKHFDLGFPYAWLVYTGMGSLNKRGMEQVEATYDFLLKALGVEDKDYYSFWDMLSESNKEG